MHIQVTQDHASKTFVKRNYRFSGEKSLCVCVCHMAIPQGGPINTTVVRLHSLPTYVVVSGSGKARFELSRCSSDLPSSPSGHAPGHEAGSYVLLVLDSCFFLCHLFKVKAIHGDLFVYLSVHPLVSLLQKLNVGYNFAIFIRLFEKRDVLWEHLRRADAQAASTGFLLSKSFIRSLSNLVNMLVCIMS